MNYIIIEIPQFLIKMDYPSGFAGFTHLQYFTDGSYSFSVDESIGARGHWRDFKNVSRYEHVEKLFELWFYNRDKHIWDLLV